MNTTTKILTIIIFGFLPIFLKGQDIEFYDFSVSTEYLPSCGSQSERYIKVDSKIKRKSLEVSWKHCKRKKRKSLPKDRNIENVINLIDSLNRLKEFTFKVNPNLIDSVKSKHFLKKTYQITDQDIDNFFENRDTITLKLQDIKKEMLERIVIDGAPYWIDLKIKRAGQDTVKYSFSGNFSDGVQTSNISNWLPMYLAYREHSFFGSIKLVEKYFSDKKLISILFRFIAWTKNKE